MKVNGYKKTGGGDSKTSMAGSVVYPEPVTF